MSQGASKLYFLRFRQANSNPILGSWEGGPQAIDERSLGVATEETTSQGLASESLDKTQDMLSNDSKALSLFGLFSVDCL